MNWIYVDRWTYELKFGNRSWADDNFPIPWDCSRQDRRLTFGGWEGFLAVKEGNFWALYFDVDGDKLKSKVEEGTPVLEVTLLRVEMRLPKPPLPPPPEVKDKEEKADEGTPDANAAAQQGGNGANNETGGQAEQQQQQQQQQQGQEQEQEQERPQQQLEQQPEKQPEEQQQAGEAAAGEASSSDKANGSTFPNGTYKKPTVEEEEEPLESPAVD